MAPSDTTTVSVSPSRSISPAAGRVSRISPGWVPSRRVLSSSMSQSKSSMAAGSASRCIPTRLAGTGWDGMVDWTYSQPPTMPTATAMTTTAAPSIRRRALRSFGDIPCDPPWGVDQGGTAPVCAGTPAGGERRAVGGDRQVEVGRVGAREPGGRADRDPAVGARRGQGDRVAAVGAGGCRAAGRPPATAPATLAAA